MIGRIYDYKKVNPHSATTLQVEYWLNVYEVECVCTWLICVQIMNCSLTLRKPAKENPVDIAIYDLKA